MAALFLQEFVGSTPWAHLDIAGPGHSDVDAGILAKGPPASAPVCCCVRWLLERTSMNAMNAGYGLPCAGPSGRPDNVADPSA